MNIKKAIDEAMLAGMSNAVCCPQLYRRALDYIRNVEATRKGIDLLRPTFCLAVHTKQQNPPILIFDTREGLIDHLSNLDA